MTQEEYEQLPACRICGGWPACYCQHDQTCPYCGEPDSPCACERNEQDD